MKLPKTATKRIIFVKTIRVILVVATIVIGLMLIGPVLRFKTSNLVERVISLPGLIRFTPSYGITYTFVPDISADGRYLVFSSDNNRLVPGDLNQTDDLFLYDVQTHHLGQISLTANGFPANGASEHPVISADGRYIAFHSQASNIADTTGSNIFVYERETGETVWISSSVETEGTSFGPAISADGRFIAFLSQFKGVFIYDREQDMLERIPQADEEERIYSEQAIMSGNGRYIAFEVSRLVADTGSNCYFVLYDQEERITQPLPLSTDKCALARYAVLSDDGRYFLFESDNNSIVGDRTDGHKSIFLLDRQTNSVERLGQTKSVAGPMRLALSPDGRFAAYATTANFTDQIVTGVWMHDRQTGLSQLVSTNRAGQPGNSNSWGDLALSDDGRFLVFPSYASNLVGGDYNEARDLFIFDQMTGETKRLTTSWLTSLLVFLLALNGIVFLLSSIWQRSHLLNEGQNEVRQ